jgi:predicted Zn-dependent protease
LLGDLHYARGDLPAALNEYRAGSHMLPEYDTLHQKLGRVLIDVGQAQLAIYELRRALEINACPAITHFLLGQAYESVGEREQAGMEYQAALNIDSQCEEARQGLENL